MKHTFGVVALGLIAALFVLVPPADAQAPDCTGTYQTRFGAVNGRGAGNMSMTITQRGNSLVWNTAHGYTYICALRGTRCSGSWSGQTGSGWFSVTFAANGSSFSGNWGYEDDHSASASFSGSR